MDEAPTTDRRAERHAAKRASILAAAWRLAHRDGLAAISLRDLAASVRPPPAVAVRLLRLQARPLRRHVRRRQPSAPRVRGPPALGRARTPSRCPRRASSRPRAVLDRRHRSPPALVPADDPRLRALAGVLRPRPRVLRHRAQDRLARRRRHRSADDVDLFSALVSGLSHQQVANDPGGDRWVRLAGRAVDMFLADVDRRRPHVAPGKEPHR